MYLVQHKCQYCYVRAVTVLNMKLQNLFSCIHQMAALMRWREIKRGEVLMALRL